MRGALVSEAMIIILAEAEIIKRKEPTGYMPAVIFEKKMALWSCRGLVGRELTY